MDWHHRPFGRDFDVRNVFSCAEFLATRLNFGSDGRTVSFSRTKESSSFEKCFPSVGLSLCLHGQDLCCRALIAGGGAPEIELALRLAEHSQTLAGACVSAQSTKRFGSLIAFHSFGQNTVPHVTIVVNCDCDGLCLMREQTHGESYF